MNPRGREQASAVGRALRKILGAKLDRLEAAHAFVSSPLKRTRETMERARAAMGLTTTGYAMSDDLKELTFGDWEGFTWPEVAARDPAGAAARARDKWSFAPPNGESYADLARRLRPWVEAIDGDLLIVSHGGVARALMYLVAGVAPEVAAEANIWQGRAILFEGGRFGWLG